MNINYLFLSKTIRTVNSVSVHRTDVAWPLIILPDLYYRNCCSSSRISQKNKNRCKNVMCIARQKEPSGKWGHQDKALCLNRRNSVCLTVWTGHNQCTMWMLMTTKALCQESVNRSFFILFSHFSHYASTNDSTLLAVSDVFSTSRITTFHIAIPNQVYSFTLEPFLL